MEKILIAIPCMDMMHTGFVRSLVGLQMPEGTCISFGQSSLIYDTRNHFIRQAIDGHFDYILWLDSDMTFTPDLLLRLMKSIEGKSIVGGLCFGRKPPYAPCVWSDTEFRVDDEGNTYPYVKRFTDIPKDIFEVASIGFACVLMRVSMAEEMCKRTRLLFSPILGFGEDLSFCINARASGFRIFCDPNVRLGHIGQLEITQDVYDSYREVTQNDSAG